MSRGITAKIDNIIEGKNLSGSQLDRLMEPKDLLMDYLSTHLSKVKKSDPLIELIKQDFTDTYNKLNDGVKLKLLELLLKKETDDNTPLINMFAKALEVKKEKEDKNNLGDNPKAPSGETSFTQEEISSAKRFLKKIDEATKGEFSDGE